MFYFYTTQKDQKTKRFLMFWGIMEMKYSLKQINSLINLELENTLEDLSRQKTLFVSKNKILSDSN